MNTISSNLFTKAFPEYEHLHTLNKVRMDKFRDSTLKIVHTDELVASVKEAAIDPLLKMNNLGLFTFDSQDGNVELKDNPVFTHGTEEGQRIYKLDKNGKKIFAIKEKWIELPYVEGFLPIKLAECLKKYFINKENTLFTKIKKSLKNKKNILFTKVELVDEDKTLDRFDVTFSIYTYEDGSTGKKAYTRAALTIDESIYEEFEDILTYETENDEGYGGGVEGLVLDRKEWTPVVFIDTKPGTYGIDKNGSLFNEIVKGLTYSIEKCGVQKGRGYMRKTKRTGKKRRAHTKKSVRR